ncbi:MAG: DNA internalization-related competence protein ComEC/Rec2 [Tissierellia bacterium]|nr:DNA internalization-related competence protein ComEC/Rec2 [Tissierellia bacterium]
MLDKKISKKILIFSLIMVNLNLYIGHKTEFIKTYEQYEIIGVVKENKIYSDDYQNIILQSKFVNNKKKSISIYATVNSEKTIEPGDSIYITGRGMTPRYLSNFNTLSYKDYLKNKGINNFIKADQIKILSTKKNILLDLKLKIKDYINSSIENNFNESDQYVLKKLILAKSQNYDVETSDLFIDFGISHLLAISGLHIGIIIYFLEIIFINLGLDYKRRCIFIISILSFYAYIIDFPSSVIRAILMYIGYIFAIIFMRRNKLLNSVFISAYFILLFAPRRINDLGFILTYLCVLSIALIYPKIETLLKNYELPQSVLIFIAINIGILPFQIYYFNKISIFALIANIIMIPLVSVVLVSTIIFLFLNLFLPVKINIFIYLIKFLLKSSFAMMELFKNNFLVSLDTFGLSENSMLSIYFVLIIILFKDRLKLNFKQKQIFYLLIIIITIGNLFIAEKTDNYMEYIDIGQGDCCLIKSGNKNILIDTGGDGFRNDNFVSDELVNVLKRKGITKIDWLLISHFDYDHCGNTEVLLNNFKIKNVGISYITDKLGLYEKLLKSDAKVHVLKNNDTIQNKYFKLEIISEDNPGYDDNDRSMVILMSFGNRKALFTGDISKTVEYEILEELPEVDIFNTPHHGSASSTSDEILDKTKPKYAIISVGRNNSYGHPAGEVLDRLKYRKIEILRTDTDGAIRFQLNDDLDYITAQGKGQFNYRELFSKIIESCFYMPIVILTKRIGDKDEILGIYE